LLGLLDDHGLGLADVSLLAVGLGPGAFTGLRVGIAAMQGLAFATGLPIVGVSGLDALASSAAAHGEPSVVGVWIDGARREVFAARYRRDPAAPFGVAALDEAVAAPPAQVRERWALDAWPDLWTGSGVTLYHDLLVGDGQPVAIAPVPVLAALVAALGEQVQASGGAHTPHALRPVYVRRPDAELARDRTRAAGAATP
jgi:tRNA threonylcarbamoyladenosine biosynthesis protein TsaB